MTSSVGVSEVFLTDPQELDCGKVVKYFFTAFFA
jgi:hypothetical protein